VRGNICDGNENAGVAIVSSRYVVVADNVLTGNDSYGVGFFPGTGEGVGHHLLGGNVYDRNRLGEIQIAKDHPAIRELQDRWPGGGAGGMNLPVKGDGHRPGQPCRGAVLSQRRREQAEGVREWGLAHSAEHDRHILVGARRRRKTDSPEEIAHGSTNGFQWSGVPKSCPSQAHSGRCPRIPAHRDAMTSPSRGKALRELPRYRAQA
jgi:hypothetical protein